MNARVAFASFAAFAACGALGGFARAAGTTPSTTWDPGRVTTSPVTDEVHGRDARVDADGAYGRFDGFLDFGLNAGAEIGDGGAAGALLGTLHYFSTAGVYIGYSDALGSSFDSTRTLSFGVDLRPAFLPRWSKDLE